MKIVLAVLLVVLVIIASVMTLVVMAVKNCPYDEDEDES